MKFIFFFAKLIFFIFVFVFALTNTHNVTLNIFPGVLDLAVDAPLVIWLCGFFLFGVIFTLGALFPRILTTKKTKSTDVS